MRTIHLLRGLLVLLVAVPTLAARSEVPAPVAAASLTFTVNSTADAPDVHPGDGICADAAGKCTLRAAIQEADAQPHGSSITINVPAGTYGLTLGTLRLTANAITISGALSSTTVISGNNTSTVMSISSTVQTHLSGVTIAGGNAGRGSGGGLVNQGLTDLSQSAIISNAAYQGGGISNGSTGRLTIVGSSVSGNSASNLAISGYGGGIYNNGGTVTVAGSTFNGNVASTNGGAIMSVGLLGPLTVTNSIFIDNVNHGYGGAISTSGPTLVSGSMLSGNSSGYGGAIYISGAAVTVSHSTLSGNVANGYGGAIYSNGGAVAVISSTISSNTARGRGGGIYNYFETMTVTGSTLDHNAVGSSGLGGGIANFGHGRLTVANSTLNANAAGEGGGIANAGDSKARVTTSTLSGNSAGTGGDLYNGSDTSTTLTLRGTIVSNSTGGPNCSGTLTDNGFNLDSGTSCGFHKVTDISNQNPLLGPLANNGGPTQTMALHRGSPAIDHGGTSATGCPMTDQRGRPRPDEAADYGACDIGAFEAQGIAGAPPSLSVNPSSGVYQQSITLTGTNFVPSETVNIYTNNTSHAPLYSPATNAAGAFILDTTADQGPYGPHTLIAVGQTSGLTATTTFTVKPLLTLKPNAGKAGSQVTASGHGFGATEPVALHWKTPTGPLLGTATSNVLGTFTGSSGIIFGVPASPPGAYLVYASGQNSGAQAVAIFFVQ